jgi:hypothetical protein
MNKIIVYGISEDNERVWMGRPTLLSWLYCFFKRGGMLTVKPIPGYEKYAYYPDRLYISFEYCNLTNEDLGRTPLASVILAEKHKGRIMFPFKSWHGEAITLDKV